MMSHHTILKRKKTAKVSPQIVVTQNHSIWSTTVHNYAPLCYQRGLKWSQMDKNSQNSIANLFKEKKVSVTHGKKGI